VLFPHPYPDELVGSLLIRSSRRLGFPIERLVQIVGLARPTRPSFIVSTNLTRIATLAAVDVEDLLMRHTVFPYVCCAASPPEIEALRVSALEGFHQPMQAVYRAQFPYQKAETLCRRCCVSCISRDRKTYGEPYWHRVHAIPGVLTCPEHKSRLLAMPTPLFQSLSNKQSYMPSEVQGQRIDWVAQRVNLRALTVSALKPLQVGLGAWHASSTSYAAIAQARGYDLNNTSDRKRLATDCEKRFGKPLLNALGFSVSQQASNSWIVQLALGNPGPRQLTLAHVILRELLEIEGKSMP
jgi:hypothetical protein